jgi:hypothetical protein
MTATLPLPLKVDKKKSRKLKRKAEPGMEGITWVRCSACGRPVFEKHSKARKMGSTCFKRLGEARTQANAARNQRLAGNQLTLFVPPPSQAESHGPNPSP